MVAYSDNGWFNTDLTLFWLQVLGSMAFGKRLLIWDSYRCHTCDAVNKDCRGKNIDCAVIPGGCTNSIQAPDVSWNKPFKASMREQYDGWLRTGDKLYTAAGNIRAVSKTILCDMVVKAWKSLSAELIQKSFLCCGQVPDATAADVSCFKDDRPAAEGRQRLLELYAMPAAAVVRLTATPDDDADDELDVDALVLGDDVSPHVSDADERSTSDDDSVDD